MSFARPGVTIREMPNEHTPGFSEDVGLAAFTSMRNVIIRPCRRDEHTAVLELWAESRSPYASTRDDVESLERLLERDPSSLLVAERAGRMIGTLIATWDGWRGNMYRLAVAVEERRSGVGLALVRAGEEHLRGCGARRVTALVGAEDEGAAALWRAAEYVHDRRVSRFVRNL
jgi:ribosomal protein S18 acetylase RimI-like enzyme